MDRNANTLPGRAGTFESRRALVTGDAALSSAARAGESAHCGQQPTVDWEHAALREKPRERRRRTKWSPDEVTELLKGVEKHGVSKWAEILADLDLHFAASRKPVDLKDKWRVMTTRRKQLSNLPTAADVVSWTPLMAAHRIDLSASPTSVAGSIPILTTTVLPPPVTFPVQQRKRTREVASPPRPPVTRAVNRGSTPPLGSPFSLFKKLTDPAMWDPASPSVASSVHIYPPPPAPPPVRRAEHHPLVLDLLPPDLMLGSMWDPADTVADPNPPDVQMKDTDTLASFFAQSTMPPSSSSNTSLAYLPPSPTVTPVTTPTPPPPLLVYPAAERGRPPTRLPPAPSTNPQDPDPNRDFFNARYHPQVDHRVPPPPKLMLDWANVMRVRSVSPESRNRFAGVARNHVDARAPPGEPASSVPVAPSSSSSSPVAANQLQQHLGFDMSEMLQAVMCLDAPTRSHVFQLLSTREFSNSPHKQAVAAKYALRPQDMVPVASPRDEAERAMGVDGEQGSVTQDMRRVLESGKQEVLRVTRRGDCDGGAGGGGQVG